MLRGFKKRDIDYQCRKKHADTRPRDEHGRFLNKDNYELGIVK